MAIYRRKATVIASRSSSNILEVMDLSTPEAQNIDPADIFSALDIILIPARNATSNKSSPAYMLSNYLSHFLGYSSDPSSQMLTTPLQFLRNLLAIPLYLCNPVMTGGSSITTQQPNLPAENQLIGADAIGLTRAVPGGRTAKIYTESAGAILLVTFNVICISSRAEIPKTSSFPIADFLMLTKAVRRGWQDGAPPSLSSFKHDDVFIWVQKSGDNKEILSSAGSVNLYPNEKEEIVVI